MRLTNLGFEIASWERLVSNWLFSEEDVGVAKRKSEGHTAELHR